MNAVVYICICFLYLLDTKIVTVAVKRFGHTNSMIGDRLNTFSSYMYFFYKLLYHRMLFKYLVN